MKDFFKTTFKTLKSKIILGIVLLVFVISIIIAFDVVNTKPKVDTTALNSLLTEASDLTTAKLRITGITNFKDSGIKFINRSDFMMVYTASVRAGIDVKDVIIDPDNINKKIYISIPEATIQDSKIEPESIKYYDEKLALFNLDEKEDANKAQFEAEQDVRENAVQTGILELANSQSENLIKGILANAIPAGYEMITKKISIEQEIPKD